MEFKYGKREVSFKRHFMTRQWNIFFNIPRYFIGCMKLLFFINISFILLVIFIPAEENEIVSFKKNVD